MMLSKADPGVRPWRRPRTMRMMLAAGVAAVTLLAVGCSSNGGAGTTSASGPVTLGIIADTTGSTATIGILPSGLSAEDARTTVSKFVMIHSGRSRLIGVVTEISLNLPPFAKEQGYLAIAEVDLMGEIRTEAAGTETFWRGAGALQECESAFSGCPQ